MIYIDVGYYDGIAERLNCIDETWTRYGFEPNPNIKIPGWVERKAAWIKNGRMNLVLNASRNDSASLEGTSGQVEDMPRIKVQTVDFSKFVSKLPEEPIICSMDCEGGEFYILPKMLKDGTMSKITFLDIEFHHRIMSDYDANDAQALIDNIQALGVIVRLKVAL